MFLYLLVYYSELIICHPKLINCHPELIICHPKLINCHPELINCHPELINCHPELVSGSQGTNISIESSIKNIISLIKKNDHQQYQYSPSK